MRTIRFCGPLVPCLLDPGYLGTSWFFGSLVPDSRIQILWGNLGFRFLGSLLPGFRFSCEVLVLWFFGSWIQVSLGNRSSFLSSWSPVQKCCWTVEYP